MSQLLTDSACEFTATPHIVSIRLLCTLVVLLLTYCPPLCIGPISSKSQIKHGNRELYQHIIEAVILTTEVLTAMVQLILQNVQDLKISY